jgi:curved DNA-binding protein CbpA
MTINPYELLGVTIASEIIDVKKAYYRLALICHEDKGGNKDDMIVLHSAYKFILNELNNINRTKTVEDLTKEFEEFCKLQQETVPKFNDIYADAFDLPKFNEYFSNNSEVSPMSYDKGYGDLMDESDNNLIYKDIEDKKVTTEFTTSIQIYKSPEESKGGFNNVVDYSDSNITNFSTQTDSGLGMSDYKEAFAPPVLTEYFNSNISTKDSLDNIIKEREKPIQTNNAYVWSFTGLLNSAGERIKDYLKLF